MKSLISVDKSVCHGKPVIAGTRIMVWQILELLEDGKSEHDIYMSYPTLPKNAIPAALQFASNNLKGISYIPFENNAEGPSLSAR